MTCHTLARSSLLFQENESEANNRLLVKTTRGGFHPPRFIWSPLKGKHAACHVVLVWSMFTLQLQRCVTSSSSSSLIVQLKLQDSVCGLWQNKISDGVIRGSATQTDVSFVHGEMTDRRNAQGFTGWQVADIQDTRWEDRTFCGLHCFWCVYCCSLSSQGAHKQIPAYRHY